MPTTLHRTAPVLVLAGLALTACASHPTAPATVSQAPGSTATPSVVTASPSASASTAAPSPQVSTAAPSTTPTAAPTAATSTSAPATTAASAPATTAGASLTETCLPTEKICFDLPAGWTLPNNVDPRPAAMVQGDVAALKDPSGKSVLYISTGISGIGGGCQNPPWTDYVINATKTKLTGYPVTWDQASDTAYVSETVTENQDGTFTPYVFLTTYKQFQQPGQHKDCQLMYANLIKGSQGKGEGATAFDLHIWGTEASQTKYPNIKRTMASKDEAAKYFDTTEAKTTAQILASAHYQK